MQLLGCQNLPFKVPCFTSRSKKEQETPKPLRLAADASDVFIKKETKTAKTPDFIEFKPAKTIDEAREFAKENLLIYDYQLTDVDCANYLNEALCEYYNKNDTKGRVVMHVLTAPKEEKNFALMNCFNWTLTVSEHMFNKVDSYIDKYLNDETVKKRCDGADKRCDLTESQKKYFEYYKTGAKNHSALPFKEKIGFMLFLRGFSGEKIVQNANGKMALPDGGPFWIINHEIGHLEHFENVGLVQYGELDTGFKKNMPREEAKARFREMEPDWESTLKVSDYASANPKEFVAETFACLQNGVKFDEDVMKLYEKYGGPKIAR